MRDKGSCIRGRKFCRINIVQNRACRILLHKENIYYFVQLFEHKIVDTVDNNVYNCLYFSNTLSFSKTHVSKTPPKINGYSGSCTCTVYSLFTIYHFGLCHKILPFLLNPFAKTHDHCLKLNNMWTFATQSGLKISLTGIRVLTISIINYVYLISNLQVLIRKRNTRLVIPLQFICQ